jgi:hypothetical protein
MVIVAKGEVDKLCALAARQGEIFKRVRNGGLSIDVALAGTQGILDGIYPTKAEYQPPSWYVGPESQAKRVQQLLDRTGCVVPIPAPPARFEPCTSTEVLMLAVYLSYDNLHLEAGVERTHKVWWDFIVPPKGHTKARWEEFKTDPDHLRLVPDRTNPEGIKKHHHGVRWIAFDPNANQGKSPRSCWNDPQIATALASAEVLMALALFPRWALSWNGASSPYPNMSGYQYYDGKGWNMTPCIVAQEGKVLLKLTAMPANSPNATAANPTVREL